MTYSFRGGELMILTLFILVARLPFEGVFFTGPFFEMSVAMLLVIVFLNENIRLLLLN